jgi:Protein of unknown function (DUF4240)
MTTVLNIHLDDLSSQFIHALKQQFGKRAEVEIRLKQASPAEKLFSEAAFWEIIDNIDWSKKAAKDKLQPAIQRLAAMPVACIFLFADKLAEKLYHLDTRQHANTYAKEEPDNFISVDDFLYARCAVVAEGEAYYKKVLNDARLMPAEIVFEPLLNLADSAYELKTNMEFNYQPTYNYETRSNLSGWK